MSCKHRQEPAHNRRRGDDQADNQSKNRYGSKQSPEDGVPELSEAGVVVVPLPRLIVDPICRLSHSMPGLAEVS